MRKFLLRARTNPVCPYCRDALSSPIQMVSCSQCRTLHHSLCWTTHQHCSVFGCEGVQTELDQTTMTAYRRRETVAGIALALFVLIFFATIVFFRILADSGHGTHTLLPILLIGAALAVTIWAVSRSSHCPACGHIEEWDVGSDYFSCPHCGVRFMPRGNPVDIFLQRRYQTRNRESDQGKGE